MTKFIISFPVIAARNRAPLTRVWTVTGNPRQPLACHWIAKPQQPGQPASAAPDPAQAHRICA